jgi:hypothetical protein
MGYDMTLLELYEKLCTGEIKMYDKYGCYGLCYALKHNIGLDDKWEFEDIMMYKVQWLENKGVMTPERETFLLLFAAYKGEL